MDWRERQRTLSRTTGDAVLEAYYNEDLDRLSSLLQSSPDYITGEASVLRGTPLCILASREDRSDVLELLYRLGDNSLKHMVYKDSSKKNCLHTAIRAKALAATQYLLTIKFDPNEPDEDIQMPLHAACVVEEPRLIKILMAAGADCNLPDEAGNMPLHQACQDGQVVISRLLMKGTADIDARGANDRTPLHYAALAQSLPLMKLLMERGASVRKYDDDRHTPMDIVLRMGNQNTLSGLADYFASMVPEDCPSINALIECEHFNRVIQVLDAIDDDMENPVESPVLTAHHKTVKLSDEEKQETINRIACDDRIDFIEFRRVVQLIAANNLSSMLIEADCIPNFVNMVRKLVLFREDVELLTTIMFGTTLWPKIQKCLEDSIEIMYENCSEIGSTGMVALMHKTFIDKERGTWRPDLMTKFFNNRLKLPLIEPIEDQNRKFLRDPTGTLTVWSVMSGRFHLTEELLKSEQFDILPNGLFCVALLRKLQVISGIPRPTKKTMEQVADRVESICMTLVRSVNTIDTSEKKMVAINFLRQRLPAYGDLTCMGLASHGQSDSFMVMQAVQGGVDREWFKRLYHTSSFYREFLIALGLIPFNPLLFVLLRKLWITTCHLEGSFPGETAQTDRIEAVVISSDDDIDDPEDSETEADEVVAEEKTEKEQDVTSSSLQLTRIIPPSQTTRLASCGKKRFCTSLADRWAGTFS
ncbi:hypothetical protein BOX15_Mlig011337g2 [Macrostomum lignano]|uniref:TRPM-like domain-containing protein n=1 Tax=Macrostomum lignano TaxID=282301 RepID=A0A267F5W7_9PLAT|nr:hypothetical protein BOX15_Mlig011337g2 [Macrostomum lignano]